MELHAQILASTVFQNEGWPFDKNKISVECLLIHDKSENEQPEANQYHISNITELLLPGTPYS